jgi:hypothetical protein
MYWPKAWIALRAIGTAQRTVGHHESQLTQPFEAVKEFVGPFAVLAQVEGSRSRLDDRVVVASFAQAVLAPGWPGVVMATSPTFLVRSRERMAASVG